MLEKYGNNVLKIVLVLDTFAILYKNLMCL